MLVLVIEDEVDLATTVEYNLRAEGFQVLELVGGYDTWAKTQKQDQPA